MKELLGALEAGGTKFRVALATTELDVVEEEEFPTTSVEQTLALVEEFFSERRIAALGIASFGPLDLRPGSPTYGSITATPKPGWSNAPLLGRLSGALDVPIGIDTDVGGAVLAEGAVGAGVGKDPLVYVTVGTGIGGAISVGGEVHHGHGHSEMGHIPVERITGDDFAGACPFHGACLEGMASGVALAERWGSEPGELLDRDEVWALEAGYLAQLVRSLTFTVAPKRIVFGGGLLNHEPLLGMVQDLVPIDLGGYGTNPELVGDPASYVVGAELGQDAGLIGAAIIARRLIG